MLPAAATRPDAGPPAPISAEDLRRWRACTRRYWLARQGLPADAAEPGTRPRPGDDDVVRGPAVDEALRAHWPLAVVVEAPRDEPGWQAAAARTQALLADGGDTREGWAVLGAVLQDGDGVRARVDVLLRGAHGFRLFGLRWATVAGEDDVDAVALAAHVAARAGWRVAGAGLLLVDTGFVYPGHGCYAGLLREVDLGPMLGTRPVADWLVAMQRDARGPRPPVPLGAPCAAAGGCGWLGACGVPADPARTAPATTSLEIVGRELAAALRAEGHRSLLTVPLARLDGARQRRAARAVQQGHAVLDRDAAGWAAGRGARPPGPPRWLRFETIGFAVPPWPGTHAYQVLPFQWTCDEQAADGRLRTHAFLATAEGGDPRRAFAVALLAALGERGPVYAYNAGFERNRLRELARRFDDLAPALEALDPRIVDLFQLLRGCWYHPAQAGSWSARAVFHAVAPDLQADRFDAPEPGCDTPLLAFAASLRKGLDPARVQTLRAALLAHGRRQTAALRRITALLDGGGAPGG